MFFITKQNILEIVDASHLNEIKKNRELSNSLSDVLRALAANAHVHANVHHSSELCVVIWSQLSYRN
jgi:hypothetical protein